mmetsp:Transcript_14745/g.22229  ORF Transcript_14745/g.22229 Transcript_14745/m.22229 type:complete len:301 (-) Transcript_14745:85-987(-)|eukprot:CAMPEP_0185020824 /NCGR_PEP_ID=MMETSP1103-20130426/3468_1 /TAXON_ID=36769 /ORGANISM="Paraphysomonas bandaiensis, Strain Caron Lab Isolate" /LENGTH=300 /DNA_ID=CAMNT_0027551967 /DNA_START=95 /DNA_END=997 /DNA_ORIENTATION=-
MALGFFASGLFVLCMSLMHCVISIADQSLATSNFARSEETELEGLPFMIPSNRIEAYNLGMSLCTLLPDGMSGYAGVAGMLTDGDCAAIYYVVSTTIDSWRINTYAENSSQQFIYVETGSFHGLSVHVAYTAVVNNGASHAGLLYAHDVFDEVNEGISMVGNRSMWEYQRDLDGGETKLQKFYSHVQRNGMQHNVIPISGPSNRTLRIHPSNSVHVMFVDGDHSYQGSLNDMHEGMRILVPGGWMLIHDVFPDDDVEKLSKMNIRREVRRAVREISSSYNVTWNFVDGTMYMAAIQKPMT